MIYGNFKEIYNFKCLPAHKRIRNYVQLNNVII